VVDKILKDMKGLFKVQDKVKFAKQNIPYLAFFYVGNIFSHHVRSYTGVDVIDRIFQGILELNTMSVIPSVHLMDILTGLHLLGTWRWIIKAKIGVRIKNAIAKNLYRIISLFYLEKPFM